MISINGRILVLCPVDGCDHDLAADIEATPNAPLHVRSDLPFSEAITEATNQASRENGKAHEAKLREHLETHDVMDWMRTVRRLEQALAQHYGGVRPHVYREEWKQ